MADEERKVKFTFTAEDAELKKVLGDTARQVKSLQDKLSKISKPAADAAKDSARLDRKINSPARARQLVDHNTKLTELSEDRLKHLQDQTKELEKQLGITKQLVSASRRGGATVASTGGMLSGMPGPGGKGPGGPGLASVALTKLPGWGKIAALVGKSLTAAVSAAGAAVAAQMRLGYGAYVDYGQSLVGLSGTNATLSGMNAARHRAVQYGYSPVQTAEQARSVAIATGNANAVTTAQMYSRATTMDMGQITGTMGALTRAGTGFGGVKGNKAGETELKNIIALGFEAGIDDARIPEFIKGVEKVVEMQGARSGGVVSSTGIAGLLQVMGASGQAGLQGSRGAALLAQLDQSIVKPGGGEAGQALMLQAMGFGKPGGNATYYEAKKMQQMGASNPENIARLFAETRGQFGGGEEQIMALSEITGLMYDPLEKLRDAFKNLTGDARKAQIEKILQGAKPPEERAADSMKELGTVAERTAYLQNRLTNIGEQTWPAIVKIQDAINQGVSFTIPYALEPLKDIADVIKKIADFFADDDEFASQGTSKPWPDSGIPSGSGFPGMEAAAFLDTKYSIKKGVALTKQEIAAIQLAMSQSPALNEAVTKAANSRLTAVDDARIIDQLLTGQGQYHTLYFEALAKLSNTVNEAIISQNRNQAVRDTSPPRMIARP